MHILARGEEELMKLLILGVIAGVWLITQIVAKVFKKPDGMRPPSRQKPQPQLGERWKRELPPVRVGRPGGPRVEVPPARTPPQRPLANRPPRINRPQPAMERRVMPSVQPQTVTAPPSPLPRREFLEALLQPRNLKKAYVLNEILQPPVSMRE